MIHWRIAIAAALAAGLGVPACAPEGRVRVLEGDAQIDSAADAERLADVVEVRGRLTVKRAAIRELSLPRLRAIRGKLYIQKNAALRRVALPALASIGSEEGDVALIERNPALVEVDLGGLRTAAHQIAVRQNPALRRLDLRSLAEIVGVGLEVADNPALEEVSIPGLVVAASVAITGCANLRRVALPDLEALGALAIENDGRLEVLDLGGLTRIAPAPDSMVSGCRLSIVGNGGLRGLHGLRSLATVLPTCEIDVRQNPGLPGCDVAALLRRLAQAGWRGVPSVCGNRIDSCGGEPCGAAAARPDAGP